MSSLETISTNLSLFGLQPNEELLLELAHPDDEIPNAAALLRLREQGTIVRVLIATDGRASTKGDPELVRNGWRKNEMQRSLGRLGIAPEHQEFLGLPDAGLDDPGVQFEYEELSANYARQHGIKNFMTMGDVGWSHSDHRVIHDATVGHANKLAAEGQDPHVWALTRYGAGSVYVPFHANFKYTLAAEHKTQFDSPRDWAELSQYGSAITHLEIYDDVPLPAKTALY